MQNQILTNIIESDNSIIRALCIILRLYATTQPHRLGHSRFMLKALTGIIMVVSFGAPLISFSQPVKERGTQPLKDWQTTLPLFIKYVDSVRSSPAGSSKVAMLEGDSRVLYFAMMESQGGCDSKTPDANFGPKVQFIGKFDKISPATANEQNGHGVQNRLSISFEITSPGSVLHIFPLLTNITTWEKLTTGTEVRFEAELQCIVGVQFPNGQVAYSLTLKNAKVLQ